MNTRICKGNTGIVTAIFALCVMPLLLATIVFYHGGLSGRQLNKGHLIDHPHVFQQLPLVTYPGLQVVDMNHLRGHWLVILVIDSDCQSCFQEKAKQLHQYWLAMGKDRMRIRPVLVLAHGQQLSTQSMPYQELIVLATHLGQWNRHLAKPYRAQNGERFIADPRGAVILAYAADSPWFDTMYDSKKLLQVSQIG